MSTTLPTDSGADAPSPPPSETFELCSQLLGVEQWSDLRKRLGKSRTRNDLAKAQMAGHLPLLWSLPDNLSPTTKSLLQLVQGFAAEAMKPPASRSTKKQGKKRAKQSSRAEAATPSRKLLQALEAWLAEVGQRPDDVSKALEALAWTRALPALAGCLDESTWAELFDALHVMAKNAGQMPFGQMPLSRQLLAAELPITLASVFQSFHSSEMEALEADGLLCVAAGIRELMDGEGLVHTSTLTHQRSLLACWTRTLTILDRSARRVKRDLREQFEWLTRQSARFTRHDGQQMLNGGRSGAWHDSMWAAAVALDQDPIDRRILSMLSWGEEPKIKSKCRPQELPQPGVYSEWAECGVLSSGWKPTDAKVAFAIHDRELETEWNAAGRTWFDGEWTWGLNVDGRDLEHGPIAEICWHEDSDVEYLELETTFDGGWTVQRQMLMDLQHQFVYVADAILGDQDADVRASMTLPLAGAVKPAVETATRELTLKSRKATIDVLPLALPEWRTAKAAGMLTCDAERLTLSQSTRGRRLYLPMFIHLNPHRDKQLTWRQLTVAANLQIEPPDAACGFRAQFGQFQWLFYRSLSQVVPRTLLGQHLNHEFFAGRFQVDGKTEELVAIEGAEHGGGADGS